MILRVKDEAANCHFFFQIQYRGRLTERKSVKDYRKLTVIKECQKAVFKKGPWESAMIMVTTLAKVLLDVPQ